MPETTPILGPHTGHIRLRVYPKMKEILAHRNIDRSDACEAIVKNDLAAQFAEWCGVAPPEEPPIMERGYSHARFLSEKYGLGGDLSAIYDKAFEFWKQRTAPKLLESIASPHTRIVRAIDVLEVNLCIEGDIRMAACFISPANKIELVFCPAEDFGL